MLYLLAYMMLVDNKVRDLVFLVGRLGLPAGLRDRHTEGIAVAGPNLPRHSPAAGGKHNTDPLQQMVEQGWTGAAALPPVRHRRPQQGLRPQHRQHRRRVCGAAVWPLFRTAGGCGRVGVVQ